MFKAAKDAVSSRAAQGYVNARIARYGQIHDLRIDSQAKSVTASCQLKGESVSIRLSIDRYTIEMREGKKYFQAQACSCDRPWLEALLADFVQGKPVELPSWAAAAL